MNKLISITLKYKLTFHEKKSKELNVKVYHRTWNSVRHWVEFTETTMRIYGIEEGTDGEKYEHDTGVTNHSTTLLSTYLDNLFKEEI